jgi:heterodisulfide reductase subunit A
MVDAARHPKIKVKTYTNVDRVEGYVGNFKVQLREKARYVRADKCNGCAIAARACPIEAELFRK